MEDNDMQFDTTGAVNLTANIRHADDDYRRWSDLDPFTQGYVEALFASSEPYFAEECVRRNEGTDGSEIDWRQGGTGLGFSDLAPKTLAAILKDCAERPKGVSPGLARTRDAGAYFWELRNVAPGLRAFPPLTPYLGDDGRVYLREGA